MVRRAISRAPSTFGGSADNMRRQVLVLITIAQRHSFSSFAIDSVKRPGAVTLCKDPDAESLPECLNKFRAELISHSSFFSRCAVSLNQEPASRQPQIKWHIALYGEGRRPLIAKGARSIARRALLFCRLRFTLWRGELYDLPSVESGVQ